MTFQITEIFVYYKSVTNTNFCHLMGSFKLKMHQNPFLAEAQSRTPLGSLRRSPDPLVG